MKYLKSWLAPQFILSGVRQKLSLPEQIDNKRQFFSAFAIFFLITFVYDILRSTKVSLIISGQDSGAEIIPFISVWGILPASILLTLIFTKLSSCLSPERVFYAMLAIFLSFFCVFALVLYPFSAAFELTTVAAYLREVLPSGMHGFVAMVRYWHFSLFYVFGELWGNIILAMIFWGYINEITSFKDAKRYYAVFALGANMAPIFSSRLCLFLRQENWDDSFNIHIGIIVIAGLLIAILFKLMQQGSAKVVHAGDVGSAKTDTKPKFGLMECFRELGKSRFLLCITLIVLSYYILYNVSDVMWSDQMHQRFKGNPGDMNVYMNQVSTYKGILATLLGFFISGSIINRWGWYPAALVTPVIYAVTCSVFFGCLFLGESSLSEVLLSAFSMSFPAFIVLVGSAQHCLIRASKFSLFDATKEIAFTPLDRASQRKGKAVIDGIGGRLGKSAGAIVLQVLLYALGGLSLVIPYLGVLALGILIMWFLAVRVLHKEIRVLENLPEISSESAPMALEINQRLT